MLPDDRQTTRGTPSPLPPKSPPPPPFSFHPSLTLYPKVIKTVIQASKGKKKAETKPSAASSSTWNEEQARAEEGEASPIAAAAAATVTAITLASGSAAEKERKGGEVAAKPLTSREVAQDIYKRAGVTGFFGGVQYASLQSALEKSIYFYAYSTMKGITKLLNGGRYGGRGGGREEKKGGPRKN